MTKEQKELLLRDLCARLPYGVMIEITSDGGIMEASYDMRLDAGLLADLLHSEDDFKPYLRPMSSMTEEEESKYNLIQGLQHWTVEDGMIQNYGNAIDWLNEHHFDYRGLITMGLALPAHEGMYE